jgi:hypothetical protein
MKESKNRQRNVSTEHQRTGCGEYALETVGLDGRMLCPPTLGRGTVIGGHNYVNHTFLSPLLAPSTAYNNFYFGSFSVSGGTIV